MNLGQALRLPQVQRSANHTMKAKLPADHGPQSVLPLTRRKTGSTGSVVRPPSSHLKTNGSTGGAINPSSFYSKTYGPSTSAYKPTPRPRSPPDTSGESEPTRKKPRLDTNSLASSADKPDVTFKKPWSTGFNPRPATKSEEDTVSKAGKSSATGGKNSTKQRLPTNRTQRKFAPKIELSFKTPSVAGSEPRDRSISDSPRTNGSVPRGTSQSTESPKSHGKEFVGNESLRAWFQQRESVKPEQRSKPDNSLAESKTSYKLTGGKIEIPASVGSTNSVVDEKRATPVDNWVLPSSLADPSPKDTPRTNNTGYFFQAQPSTQSQKQQPSSKHPPLSQQHLEGWPFVPAPVPDKKQSREPPRQTVSDLDFDSLIYRQEGAATPPRGISVNVRKAEPPPLPPKPAQLDGPFYAHIDPRVHWPQPHSAEWYEKKLKEIQARGGRKASFGGAAQRLKQRREAEGPVSFEDSLPSKIRENPAWVRALKELHEDQSQDEASKRKGGQRGPKAGRQGLKRQASTTGPTTPRKS